MKKNKDTERLNWIGSYSDHAVYRVHGVNPVWTARKYVKDETFEYVGKTPRQAIDAAIRSDRRARRLVFEITEKRKGGRKGGGK